MKKILIGACMIVVLFLGYKFAVAQNTENVDPAEHIRNVVLDGTPDFISAAVLNTVDWMEGIREGKKDTRYIGFIFKSPYLFYGLLGILAFHLARFISRLVFKS